MTKTKTKQNIPKGWQRARLGDFGITLGGLSGKNKTHFGDGKPFITYMNVFSNSHLDREAVGFVEIKEGEKQNKLQYGDYLFTTSSETPEEVGMSSVVDFEPSELYLNSFCFIFRPEKDLVEAKFGGYMFRGPVFRKEIATHAKGSTRFNLSKKDFLSVDVIFPDSKKEQKKIAEILSAVDDEIQKTDEIILATEKLKRGLMQKLLFNGKKKIHFSDLVNLRKETFDPKTEKTEKYVGLEHVDQDTGILLGFGDSKETKSLKTRFHKGDILFGKLRPYLRKYWKADVDGVCTTEIFVFEPKQEEDADYIFYLVQSDQFISNSHSKSFGTKMPRTNWDIVSSFEFKAPDAEERKRAGNILTAVDEKISVNRKLKEKLTLLKKGLMQDLLSGSKRVI